MLIIFCIVGILSSIIPYFICIYLYLREVKSYLYFLCPIIIGLFTVFHKFSNPYPNAEGSVMLYGFILHPLLFFTATYAAEFFIYARISAGVSENMGEKNG